MKATKDLTQGNIYKNLMLYAFPLILSSMISLAYSTVDGIIAGKFISENALGAVSSTGSFDIMYVALFSGFSAGFSIYISHLFGEKQYAIIKQDSVAILSFTAVLSIFVSAAAILFRNPILDYLKVDPILRHDAEIYFSIYTAGYLFQTINMFCSCILSALGISAFSFYVSLLSAGVNLVGNLLMVLVFNMGVAGLAISTVASTLLSTAIYFWNMRKAFADMKCEKVSYRFRFYAITRSLRYSLPTATQLLVYHGVNFIIAPPLNALGAAATTGYNVANRIGGLGTQALWGTSSAFGCYTAQCVGKRDTQKMQRGLRVGFLLAVLVTLPFILTFTAFPHTFVSLFFPSGFEGESYQYAIRYARVFLPLVYFQVIEHMLHSYMRSLGAVTTVLGITCFGSTVRIVATLVLIPLIGLDGVFLGQASSWAADAAVSATIVLCFFRSEAHLRRAIQRIRKAD